MRLLPVGQALFATATVTTGDDGSYSVPDPPPGANHVLVSPSPGSGFVQRWYVGSAGRGGATPVILGAQTVTGGIDLTYDDAAAISGVVSGPGGPLAGARVISDRRWNRLPSTERRMPVTALAVDRHV